MSERELENLRRFIEVDMQEKFKVSLPDRVARALKIRQHQIIPGHHFAAASWECIQLWRDGYFLSVLMVSQALVEGICRHVLDKNDLPYCGNPPQSADILRRRSLITVDCEKAISRIWKSYRNDVHHMNPKIADVQHEFEAIAQRNVEDLLTIEGEIFAYDIVDGKLRPKQPHYWRETNADGTTEIFVRAF